MLPHGEKRKPRSEVTINVSRLIIAGSQKQWRLRSGGDVGVRLGPWWQPVQPMVATGAGIYLFCGWLIDISWVYPHVSTNTYLGQPTGWVDDQPHHGVLMGYMMVIQWHLMGFKWI